MAEKDYEPHRAVHDVIEAILGLYYLTSCERQRQNWRSDVIVGAGATAQR